MSLAVTKFMLCYCSDTWMKRQTRRMDLPTDDTSNFPNAEDADRRVEYRQESFVVNW